MAEPLGASPRPAVVGDQDGVLATKLYVPPRQEGFIPRARLVERLNEGLTRALILVCAPAGFGKTALLADWGRGSHAELAWLSLDVGDSDPARFWRHAIAALDRVRPGLYARLAPLLGPPAPPLFDGLAAGLINELAAPSSQGDVLLVLDDYHLVESRAVHESLTFLLEHAPPALRLVLSSREDPPFALARRRVRGQLAELRAADLRFTLEEAAALLRQAVGPALPEAAVSALAARTEGWAAGLQLAALSLLGRPDLVAFLEAFSGSHRYVLDYLTEEVLDGQPDRVRTFLLETSVLDRLSGDLCDAVTGRTDGQAMLEAVERANLFLVPLDEVRGWWRYHHLFADLLRARLQQQRPGRLAGLHRAAAAWCEDHGLADDAVRHALAAGDAAWSMRLIERHADAFLLRSEGATLQRWLAALPAGLAGSRPRLLLAQARLALLSHRVETAEVALDAAERALASAPGVADEPFEPSVGRPASHLANVPAAIALGRTLLAVLHGDAERAITFGRQTLAEAGEGEWLLTSHANGYLGVAEWLRGQLAEAERALSSSIAQGRAAGQPALTAWGYHDLGKVQRAQGRLDTAAGTYRQALEINAPPGRPVLPPAGIGYVGLAEVAYQRNELDTALRHVTEGIVLCRLLNFTQPLATGLATLAWIRQASGDPGGAREAMEEARQAAPGPAVTALLNPVPAQQARLQLAQGDVAAAARWTEERELSPDDAVSYSREPEYLVLARVLIAQNLPDLALGLLARLHAVATVQGRMGSVIQIQALRALALAAAGEQADAVATLAETLTLAHRESYVRVFADEGAAMATLLARLVATRGRDLIAAGVSVGYLSRLGAAIAPQTARPASPGHQFAGSRVAVIPGLIEALSERELEVLQLLVAGKANREIANELFVAPDTVKKHITHILGKLAATNRTEAAARARELGLVT